MCSFQIMSEEIHGFKYPNSWDVTILPYENVEEVKIKEIIQILKNEANNDYYPDEEYLNSIEKNSYNTKPVKIFKFGTIDNGITKYHLFISILEWGLNPKYIKETRRLLVFSEKWHYLGNYYLELLPERIEGNTVIFTCDEKWNKLVFDEKEPPKEIYVDGIFYTFDTMLNEKYMKEIEKVK